MHRFGNLNPYERHKLIINEYVLNRPGKTELLQHDTSKGKRDIDIIRENHKFLWENRDEAKTWEEQLAKKYYDKLFKEYCISDLSRYKENKVALRWRIEKEVVIGKGQFICGNKICSESDGLRSWEVNFAYMESGERKNVLVKLRLCPACSDKLNYHSKKREVKKHKKRIKEKRKDKTTGKKPKLEYNLLHTENVKDIDESEGNTGTIIRQEYTEEEEEDHWKETTKEEEPTREEEFERYLEDLLL